MKERAQPGGNRAAGNNTSGVLKLFNISQILNVLLLAGKDPGREAYRLVEAAASGRIQTPGAWRDLVGRIERLPDNLRRWAWQQVAIRLGPAAAGYLKRWREYRRERR